MTWMGMERPGVYDYGQRLKRLFFLRLMILQGKVDRFRE